MTRGIGVGALAQDLEAADALRPVERHQIILDAQHGRRVDRLARENAGIELAALRHAEDLRQRPGRHMRLEPLDRARRQDDDAMGPLAAQHLLPGERHDIELGEIERLREGGRGRIANGQALPVGRNPVGVRHAHARCGAVPGEDHIMAEIDAGQIGKLAIGRLQDARILELQLLDDIADPAFAKTFPGQKVDAGGRRAATTGPFRPRPYRRRAQCRSDGCPVLPGLSRVSVIACLRRALPSLERCERPVNALREEIGCPARDLGARAG